MLEQVGQLTAGGGLNANVRRGLLRRFGQAEGGDPKFDDLSLGTAVQVYIKKNTYPVYSSSKRE